MNSINLSKEKNKPNMLSLKNRITSFDEVCLGYNEESAVSEANRCLNCINSPCKTGCPLNNNIPEFIQCIKNCDFESAFKFIEQKSNFPAICSRICAQEKQCESKCTRGLNGEPVSIGMLERFVTDWHYNNFKQNNHIKIDTQQAVNHTKKIAIIGSGVSGLACAEDLTNLGYDVTIFELTDYIGGIAYYSIPDFRLPRKIVVNEIERIKSKGVKITTNYLSKKLFSIKNLEEEFDAIYIASGADYPKKMGIEGEQFNGVFYANDFLKKSKMNDNNFENNYISGKIVAIVGGGNVAFDSARTMIRLGAKKVYIIYRRSLEEMPARKSEIRETQEEGVEILFLTNPIQIIGKSNEEKNLKSLNQTNSCVCGVKCVKMKLGENDTNGRRKPITIENSDFIIPIDAIVMAISSTTSQVTKDFVGESLFNEFGLIETDENHKTKSEKIFAGGDVVSGPKTIVSAIADGKKSANNIHKFLHQKDNNK